MLTLKNSNLQNRVKMAKSHFYRTYTYMIRFNLPGASLFRCPPVWLSDDTLPIPAKTTVRYGYSNVKINPVDLRNMYKFVQKYECKVRVEGNVFNAYFEDVDQLEEMLDVAPEKWVREIHYVPSQIGYKQVVVKQKRLQEMTHRIHLRNGRLTDQESKQIRLLIEQYEDSVEFPIGLRKKLNRETRPYLFSNYFYTKDSKLITFISLSMPGVVTDIFETVHVS